MGSNLSGAVSEVSIAVSLLLAVVLLDERLSIGQLAGIGLIFLGAFMVPERTADMGTAVFRPNVAEGYVISLVSAAAYGTSLSQVFRYIALSLAPVTVVSPIQRLSLAFRALFGLAINREYETWNRRVLFALLVALLGGVAVALG